MRILIIATTAVALVSGSVWAATDYNSSRSNRTTSSVAAPSGDDPVVRKKPGRTTYGDITLKRGVAGATAPDTQPAQIDPPSLQLDAGPSDTSTTRAKSSKPKEIVVVGSKTKDGKEKDDKGVALEGLSPEGNSTKSMFKPDGTPLRGTMTTQ
ncbi:MAG: hypothetical protein E2O92_08620 [Alphaproteobacteria bacterium]|nr:MAG: hypothetical protein E2O92_08620 [Alphaproteobacteria bacterium]